ncbi:hypothetical protein ACFPOE_07345 [Caenimonas terrae]|uniref:Uncharacterized protein n=1 Tax=Caenimonas terrae TaxID=696074 RepID=A0ABW0NEC4_9BURK
MIFRVANWLFVLECLFAVAFVLTAVPIGEVGTALLRASAGALGFVILGGYCVLAVGGLLYLWVAVAGIRRGVASFWSSFLPAIFGLPVIVWGFGKVQAASNPSISVLSGLVALLVAVFLLARTPITKWRAVPALLPIIFFATLDFEKAGWLHLLIGMLLVVAPLPRLLNSLCVRASD